MAGLSAARTWPRGAAHSSAASMGSEDRNRVMGTSQEASVSTIVRANGTGGQEAEAPVRVGDLNENYPRGSRWFQSGPLVASRRVPFRHLLFRHQTARRWRAGSCDAVKLWDLLNAPDWPRPFADIRCWG